MYKGSSVSLLKMVFLAESGAFLSYSQHWTMEPSTAPRRRPINADCSWGRQPDILEQLCNEQLNCDQQTKNTMRAFKDKQGLK